MMGDSLAGHWQMTQPETGYSPAGYVTTRRIVLVHLDASTSFDYHLTF